MAMANPLREQALMEKIRELPEDKVAAVEDFVDFLCRNNPNLRLSWSALLTSEDGLRNVWDNPEDAEYDRL